MDLSTAANNPPCSNQQRQHQYVNGWRHKATPSSQQTATIDLSRPLAPVYHCNVPVISQTGGPVIVTAADRWRAPPQPTWHANDSSWQWQSQPSNTHRPQPIYEISDDDMVESDEAMLVIDEYVNSSGSMSPNMREIESGAKRLPVAISNNRGCQQTFQSNVAELEKIRRRNEDTLASPAKKSTESPSKMDQISMKPSLKLVVKSKIIDGKDTKSPTATLNQNVKLDDYRVKVDGSSSAMKLTIVKFSKDISSKHHSVPPSMSRSTSQNSSSSSGSVKSSPAAENRDKHKGSRGDHKYEKHRESDGKQTTYKSSSNNTKSHKVVSKSHDSTKKSAEPREQDEAVEMKKQQEPLQQHTSAKMSITANKPETKHDGRGDKSHVKPTAAGADSKKVVRSDGYLRRKFGCRKTPKVMLRRMTKQEIHRFTHRTFRIPRKSNMLLPKLKSLGVSSIVDKNLQASALMDLMVVPASKGSAPTPRAKIKFAPRRVVKCHKTAATAAPVGKQRQPQPAFHDQLQESTEMCVPSEETFPREMIGLLERDIERAVPLEIFINNTERSDEIDWFVLDGKMQSAALLRQPMKRTVKVKILMPPQYFATDLKYQVEEQQMSRNEAVAKYLEQHQPLKVQSEKAKLSHIRVRENMKLTSDNCCTAEEKAVFRKQIEAASKKSFIDLFPTPQVSIEKQQKLLPNHWRSKILSDPFLIGKYLLRGVNPLSREFAYVQSKFNKTSREPVLAIDKVENPHLWFRYQLQKERMKLRSPIVQEFHLFHGTDIKNLQSILSNNLDCQYVGKKKGSRFGKGVYFSPLSSYSLHYTNRSPHHSIMILFRVLTVKQCIGFEDTVLPENAFDTAINENGKVWAKFDMDEFYPDYVIHFQYLDPEDKTVVYSKYRKSLEKKHAEKWKRKFKQHTLWNVFRQKHQKRPMTWKMFYQRVKRWRLKPLKKSRGLRLKCAEWKGPHEKTSRARKQKTKTKLQAAPYRSMSIWKQPRYTSKNSWKGRGSYTGYRAKKR